MRYDTYLDKQLSLQLFKDKEEEAASHRASGKLSASQLNWPLQWQILKARGIEPPPFDAYTLRKFARGQHVEDWFLSKISGIVDTQKTVTYRNAVGRYDALVDTKDWDWNMGVIPLEVKSVTNAKFKHIGHRKESDKGHMLQATFYAMALQKEHYALAYIASDDYRVRVHIHSVAEMSSAVDGIITEFETQLRSGIVPVFVPREPWQATPQYNNYPDWAKLKEDEINKKIKEHESTSTGGKKLRTRASR